MNDSHARGPAATPLLTETISHNLRRTSDAWAGSEALVVRDPPFRATYGRLVAMTELVARGLMATGVGPGERVGVIAPNRYEWVLSQYATAAIGGILVPINPHDREAGLEYVLRDAGVRVLLHAGSFRSTDLSAMVAAVRGRCPGLRGVVDLDRDWTDLVRRSGAVSPAELARREAAVRPDDPAAILYTSGTTGSPKGVTLSHGNVLNNAFFVGQSLRYTARDRVCVPVPFFHCFGMVLGNLACTAHGACIVVPCESYEPTAVLDAIQGEACTSVYGVPTMFVRQLAHPQFERFDLSSLRTGIMGGSTCPPNLVRQVVSRMGIAGLTIAYGMTETSPISIQTSPDDPLERRATTVGRVLPHLEVKVIDLADGAVVSRGGEGEVCVRGYSVMLGYWNDPSATRAAVDEGGWMHTGDLAVMEPDGCFRISGRIKDLVIVGGENVSPAEIEGVLSGHPGVGEAQVIGVPDAHYGEQVMAWVRRRKGSAVEAGELAAFCRRSLAGSKVPRYWKFVDDFPVTASGKVRKRVMREMAAAELGLAAADDRTAAS